MQKTLSVIDLRAIRANARHVRSLIGDRFFYAVVKADAYGHGAEEVARSLSDVADGFCVAIVDEGASLRICGITKPILVLTPPLDKADAEKMKFYSLTPTVGDERSARLCKGMRCHVAINTGMNRYGCCGKILGSVLSVLPKGSVEGVFSHLYAAQSERHCQAQLSRFLPAAERVKRHSAGAISHLAASGGILRGGQYLQQGVRCGLMLYGYAPSGFSSVGLKPALSVYARLAQEITPVGEGIGYNVADEDYDKLYTYRLGYADGFARGVPLGEKSLCMDSFISRRGGELLPVLTDAEEYAKRCGTIAYEVLCSATRRSERVYLK